MKAELADRTWTELAGYAPDPIPVAGCTSPEYFEREREAIFKRVWLNVGRVSSIPNAGDYFVRPLVVGDTSVIVARGKDGEIRAFHNMCAHRCNQVVWNDRGCEQVLRCRFHGWSYGLDGRLVAAPDEEEFHGLDKDLLGLEPINLDVWEDFIFVNLAPEPPETLRDFLGPFYDGLHGYPFHELTQTYEWVLDMKCNWKIFRDAFLEVYHVAFLHGPSVGDAHSTPDNPYIHALDIRLHGYHSQYSIYGNPNHTERPVESIANQFVDSVIKRQGRTNIKSAPLMNPTDAETWAGEIFPVFPNMHLNLFPGLMLYHNYWPIDVDRTIVQLRQCQPKPQTASQRWGQEYAKVMNRDSSAEDVNTVELTQAVLKSGAKSHFVLSDQELMVRHSHNTIQQFAGPYPEAGGAR